MLLSSNGPTPSTSTAAAQWLEARLWPGSAMVVLETNSDWITGHVQHGGSSKDAMCAPVSDVSNF
jgi:hypothetical protein